ncbi:uncharacterized protein LOC144442193 isoform X2 [Glandiceps talaboti]
MQSSMESKHTSSASAAKTQTSFWANCSTSGIVCVLCTVAVVAFALVNNTKVGDLACKIEKLENDVRVLQRTNELLTNELHELRTNGKTEENSGEGDTEWEDSGDEFEGSRLVRLLTGIAGSNPRHNQLSPKQIEDRRKGDLGYTDFIGEYDPANDDLANEILVRVKRGKGGKRGGKGRGKNRKGEKGEKGERGATGGHSIIAAHFQGDTTSAVHTGPNGRIHFWTYADWMNEDEQKHMKDKFKLSVNGEITVTDPGLYYVYSQITYQDANNPFVGHHVFIGQKKFISCKNFDSDYSYNSCFTAGITYINHNEAVSVKLPESSSDDHPYQVIQEEDNTFVGFIKLKDMK